MLNWLSEVLVERYKEAPRRDLLVLKNVGISVYLSLLLKAASPFLFFLNVIHLAVYFFHVASTLPFSLCY